MAYFFSTSLLRLKAFLLLRGDDLGEILHPWAIGFDGLPTGESFGVTNLDSLRTGNPFSFSCFRPTREGTGEAGVDISSSLVRSFSDMDRSKVGFACRYQLLELDDWESTDWGPGKSLLLRASFGWDLLLVENISVSDGRLTKPLAASSSLLSINIRFLMCWIWMSFISGLWSVTSNDLLLRAT